MLLVLYNNIFKPKIIIPGMMEWQNLDELLGVKVVYAPNYDGYDVFRPNLRSTIEGGAFFSEDKATLRCYLNAARFAKKNSFDAIGHSGWASWDRGLITVVKYEFCFWKNELIGKTPVWPWPCLK